MCTNALLRMQSLFYVFFIWFSNFVLIIVFITVHGGQWHSAVRTYCHRVIYYQITNIVRSNYGLNTFKDVNYV